LLDDVDTWIAKKVFLEQLMPTKSPLISAATKYILERIEPVVRKKSFMKVLLALIFEAEYSCRLKTANGEKSDSFAGWALTAYFQEIPFEIFTPDF